jgi:hypothetical protein
MSRWPYGTLGVSVSDWDKIERLLEEGRVIVIVIAKHPADARKWRTEYAPPQRTMDQG